MKSFKIFLLFVLFSTALSAQSFIVRDHYGKIVNNDTLVVIFHPDTNHGWTELSVFLYVQNISSSTLTLGAKKTEYNIQQGEYHAICFGGTCFDSTTFVSPFKDPVNPGGIDSTFSGHFRFDDLLHPPGRCLVAYTFYDDNNPNDSSIVYVEYNTMEKAGVGTNMVPSSIEVRPNPSSGLVHLQYSILNKINREKSYIQVINSLGECVRIIDLEEAEVLVSLDLKELAAGIYHICVIHDGSVLITDKLMISY